MFLLSYTKSDEFRKNFQHCVLNSSFWDQPDGDLARDYRDRLDPGSAVGQYMGYRTTRVLSELIGVEHEGIGYAELFRSIGLTPKDRREVGRAMVLADMEFGLIDELVWNGFRSAFSDFASYRDYSFSVGKQKKLTADELKEYFAPYFLPAEKRIDPPVPLRLKLRMGKTTVDLEFQPGDAAGAIWIDRSFKLRPKQNDELLRDLNWSLDDFRQRLDWMENYRKADALPGIDSRVRSELSSAIRKTYSCSYPDLDYIMAGIYFEGESTAVKIGERHSGFAGRCGDCQQIVALDIYRKPSYSLEKEVDWSSSYRDSAADDVIDELLQDAHRARGCEGSHYISSRNGEKLKLRRVLYRTSRARYPGNQW